jgi:hypothetical protein
VVEKPKGIIMESSFEKLSASAHELDAMLNDWHQRFPYRSLGHVKALQLIEDLNERLELVRSLLLSMTVHICTHQDSPLHSPESLALVERMQAVRCKYAKFDDFHLAQLEEAKPEPDTTTPALSS